MHLIVLFFQKTFQIMYTSTNSVTVFLSVCCKIFPGLYLPLLVIYGVVAFGVNLRDQQAWPLPLRTVIARAELNDVGELDHPSG